MAGLIPIMGYFVVDIYCYLVVVSPTIHILIKSPSIVKWHVNCNHLKGFSPPKLFLLFFIFSKINLAIVFKLIYLDCRYIR